MLVPVTLAGQEAPAPDPLERSLASAHIPLLPSAQAAAVLEAAHSSDAASTEPEELARLDKLIGAGARALAANRRHEGAELFQQLEREPAAVRDYLRRDPARAQYLVDACVTTAWLEHQERGREQAKQQLQQCIRMFPSVRPTDAPKKLLALFDEVARAAADEPQGRLEVSGRERCLVRLNGSAVGRAPLQVDVPIGPVRVQLKCEPATGPARIHAVTIQPGTTRLRIDAAFDAALRTNAGLRLSLEHATTAELAQLGEVLGELVRARVILIVPAQSEGVRLLATHPAHELGAFASLTAAQGPLIADLRARQPPPAPPVPSPARGQPQPTEPLAQAVRLDTPPPTQTDKGSSLWPSIAAGVGVAIGIGGVTVSWVYYAQRIGLRTDWGRQTFSDRDAFRALRRESLIFGLAGNLVLASAEYALLPKAQGIPLLAWAAAGVGAAFAGAGVVATYAQRTCSLPSPTCTGFGNDPLFGELLMGHALPLVAVPVNYWLRSLIDAPVRVELGLGGGLQVSGTF